MRTSSGRCSRAHDDTWACPPAKADGANGVAPSVFEGSTGSRPAEQNRGGGKTHLAVKTAGAFWVICDEKKAHLFFTSNNGLLWRAETPLDQFPHGWTEPKVVLRGDLFEASCTYRLKGTGRYLTIVEAETHRPGGWRYYKAYLADALDGEWKPLADTWEKPFAGPVNVTFAGGKWSDSISHGELLRAGIDQRLEVDPEHLRFLYQGVLEADRKGKIYGQIPWRLGILSAGAE